MDKAAEVASDKGKDEANQPSAETEADLEDMDYYIEHLLNTLEKKPREEWPTDITQLEKFLESTTEASPVQPEYLLTFLVQEGFLKQTTPNGPEFQWTLDEIEDFDFREVVPAWLDFLNSLREKASQTPVDEEDRIKTVPRVEALALKKTIAWLRLNHSEIPPKLPITELRDALIKHSKIEYEPDNKIVLEEMQARNLFRLSEEDKTKIQWFGNEKSEEQGWFKYLLGIFLVILFWSQMLAQILPAGGGMKRARRAPAEDL